MKNIICLLRRKERSRRRRRRRRRCWRCFCDLSKTAAGWCAPNSYETYNGGGGEEKNQQSRLEWEVGINATRAGRGTGKNNSKNKIKLSVRGEKQTHSVFRTANTHNFRNTKRKLIHYSRCVHFVYALYVYTEYASARARARINVLRCVYVTYKIKT